MTPEEQPQFERLLARLIDDQLTAEEWVALEQVLLADPQAREQYRSIVKINALLGARLQGPEHQALPAVLQEPGEVETASASAIRRRKQSLAEATSPLTLAYWRARPLRFGGLALVLTLLLWTGFYFTVLRDLQNRVQPHDDSAGFLARVIETESPVWTGETASLAVGDELKEGQEIELYNGFVQLEFGNGAVVLVEGPARFVVDSRGAGTLKRGRVVARIVKLEEGKVGFSISTQLALITDLGTEFGVAVADDDTTTVEVFQGLVEALPLQGNSSTRPQPLRLRKGQAARIARDQTAFDTRDPAPGQFVQEIPEQAGQVIVPISATSDLESATPAAILIDGKGLNQQGRIERWTFERTTSSIWAINGSQAPCGVTFDLGEMYELDKVWVWNFAATEELYYRNNSVKTVGLEVSENGTEFIVLGEIELQPTSSSQSQAQGFSLSSPARYVRLVVIDGYHDEELLGSVELSTLGLSQVRFQGVPVERPSTSDETSR